jgi:tRNA threonylcarbamoyl adenosine modification protein YeaZ
MDLARHRVAAREPTMLTLALDAALDRCAAALIDDDRLLDERTVPGGEASRLPDLARALLDTAPTPHLIAVTVGPGSFTGIRAALALAHGIADGAGIAVVGVTVGEAIALALPHLGERELWVACENRRGRLFLERAPGTALARIDAFDLDALPAPDRPVALAGTAAGPVAARLAARNLPVMLTDARRPLPRHIALAGQARRAGRLSPLAAQPLYVDPPEAKLPAGGLRPAPSG